MGSGEANNSEKTKEKYKNKSSDKDLEMANKKKNKVRSRKDSSGSEQSNYDFTPITDKHSCTDIICTVLFFIFIIALVAVSIFAYMSGNPGSLIKPRDSNGNICGETEGYQNKSYLFFFDLTRCLSVINEKGFGCPTKQICVEKCPEKTSIANDDIKLFCDPKDAKNCPSYLLSSAPLFGRCVPKIISTFSDLIKNTTITDQDNKTISVDIGNGSVPLTLDTLFQSAKYLKNILDLKGIAETAYEDLSKSYLFILIALAIGALVAFIWMFVLRFLIKPMIFVAIVAVLALNAFAVAFCVWEYLELNKTKPVEVELSLNKLLDFDYLLSLKETWLALSIILGVLFLVLFLVIIFLRKRIKIAAELIKETSKAITSIPSALIWPVFPFLLQLGIIFLCGSTALYLASSGIPLFKIVDTRLNQTNLTTNSNFKIGEYCDPISFNKTKQNDSSLDSFECNFYTIGFDVDFVKKLINSNSQFIEKYSRIALELINKYQWIPQVFVLFMFFWLISFTLALNEMTLAGSFGAWYWTRFENVDKGLKNKLPFFTLLGSLGRALFYHLGTLAFGSLIIAIIKIIRTLIEFFSNKFKNQTDQSKIAKFIVACCKCCFWCLEKFLRFLNKNAFIITAIYSLNFCSAASKAFKLILTNPLRFAVVDKTAGFILFLSNLAITSLIGILSFLFFTKTIDIPGLSKYVPSLTYYFVPIVLIIIGVFVISKLFFDVFSMGVDTMLMCVLIDCEENDGSKSKPYFMTKKLKKLFNVKKL